MGLKNMTMKEVGPILSEFVSNVTSSLIDYSMSSGAGNSGATDAGSMPGFQVDPAGLEEALTGWTEMLNEEGETNWDAQCGGADDWATPEEMYNEVR